MKTLKTLTSIGLVLMLFACNQTKTKTPSNAVVKRDTSLTTLTIPAIPLTLSTPESRADFLMEHYWDNYDFADTSLIHKASYSEQAFADFINILNNVPIEVASKGVKEFMNRSTDETTVFLYFSELAEKYLYDPNATTRNENVFESFLKAKIANKHLDDAYKIRARSLLKLIQQNKVGTTATDFAFTLVNGSKSRLSAIDAKLLLIYFHNPDCHECKATREKMEASPLFQKLTKEGSLKVLALYPDEDLAAFKKYQKEMPSEWIYAYDKGGIIKKNDLYDLKAIPSLYLLDQDKTILLKDVPFEGLEAYLGDDKAYLN